MSTEPENDNLNVSHTKSTGDTRALGVPPMVCAVHGQDAHATCFGDRGFCGEIGFPRRCRRGRQSESSVIHFKGLRSQTTVSKDSDYQSASMRWG